VNTVPTTVPIPLPDISTRSALVDFHPSIPVPTTIQIPLPHARKTTVLFEFHPSANQTALRIVGGDRGTTVVACATSGVDSAGLWGRFWHGCIGVPSNGVLLPADDGSMHVGVLVHVTSRMRLNQARLVVTYLPGDFYFSEVSMTPRQKRASFSMTTASPVLLGAGVGGPCGGRFTVSVAGRLIVTKSVQPTRGKWVNELPATGSAYTFSLSHLHCRASGENVGLGTATGSPGGP
jgi:hypothetical protein